MALQFLCVIVIIYYFYDAICSPIMSTMLLGDGFGDWMYLFYLFGFRASEGKTVEVPFKGPVDVTLRDVLGGVRSTCTYVGAAKLKELSRRTTFIRVTQQLNTVFGTDN